MQLGYRTLADAHKWAQIYDRVNQLSGLSGDERLTEDEVFDLVQAILEQESRRIAQQYYYMR